MKILELTPIVYRIFCAVLILSLTSCKGGSSLIGFRITGEISNLPQGTDVLITIKETGESDRTDSKSKFEIFSSIFSDNLTLVINTNNISQELFLNNIPPSVEKIFLKINFNSTAFEITETSYSPESDFIYPTPTNTPAPSPSTPPPASTPLATPSPTQNNTQAISDGKRVWSKQCASCHAREKSGRGAREIRNALKNIPEMRNLKLSNDSISNVVAYLNRNRS